MDRVGTPVTVYSFPDKSVVVAVIERYEVTAIAVLWSSLALHGGSVGSLLKLFILKMYV